MIRHFQHKAAFLSCLLLGGTAIPQAALAQDGPSIAVASPPITSVANVPIDENRDGEVTIAFDPLSNYMPVRHGSAVDSSALKPFGAETEPDMVVQECGQNLNNRSLCAVSSGDRDGYAGLVRGDVLTLSFSPPITSLSLSAMPVSVAGEYQFGIDLMDEAGKRVGQASATRPDPRRALSTVAAVVTPQYWAQVSTSPSIGVVSAVQPANIVHSARIWMKGPQTDGFLVDSLLLTRKVDDNGQVIVLRPPQRPNPDTSDLPRPRPFTQLIGSIQERRAASDRPLARISPRDIERRFDLAKEQPGARVPVRLEVDWDEARDLFRTQRDFNIRPAFRVRDDKLSRIELPVLLPKDADGDPIIMAAPDTYHAVKQIGKGSLRIKGTRVVYPRDFPNNLEIEAVRGIEIFETEAGLTANFYLFGVSYSVSWSCEIYGGKENACLDREAFRQQLDDLALTLPTIRRGGE